LSRGGSDGAGAGASEADGSGLPGLSTLLADLARTPERELQEAWARGPRPGDVVGRFELVRELGRGGFGVVFEARDRELNRSVAFKVIRPGRREQEPMRAALLRREAEAVAQLSHPNIVTLYDAGRCESGPFLVLELLAGEPLDRRIARGPMAAEEALAVATGVARALVHAHDRGVLHRDLKPGNVFLAGDGAPKVLDFGLAHVFGLQSPRGAGTPGYMAPEQRRGEEEDARADVWAVGVLLWEMLTGRRLGEEDFVEGQGAPPRLAGPGIPAALADVVARCLAADAADRPATAVELRDALERISQRAARGLRARRLLAAALAAAALAGAVGWVLGLRRGGGAGLPVVVADAQNVTGSAQLDGIAGMLQSSLEQSRRLSVIPRERVLSLAEAAGLDPARRVAGEGARTVALRAGATVVLQLDVARDAAGYVLGLRCVDPGGRVRFTLTETAPDEPSVPPAVDRLSRRARIELGERPEELRGAQVEVGRALTADLEAYRHYFLGEQCAARPVYGQDCSPHFRRAAERDPAFAAAHYQLALWSFWFGGPREEQLQAIAEAVDHAADAPEKERLLIRAWDAYLHGREDEALADYATITVRWPQDRVGWYQHGEILRRREELAAAVPWFEKAAEVDPEHGWTLAHLAECLGGAGRLDALRDWVARWEARARPAELHALVTAYGWLGDAAAAEGAAKRAIALGGGVSAQEDLLAVWTMQGRFAEVEAAVRGLAKPGSEIRPMGYYALAAMDAYRGRRATGRATLDALGQALPALERQSLYRNARIEYLLGDRDLAAVRRELAALAASDPPAAAEHAAEVAWLGDPALAASLAAGLRPGSPPRRAADAVAKVRRGDVEAGLAELRDLSATTPVFTWRVAPVFLYGDLAAEAGRCGEALEALARFQRTWQPIAMWRSWALPWARQRVAACEAKAGAR
jgi:tetratricopeptide (TPR) repeat protein